MHLGWKARIMMVAGTLCALLFLMLGMREMQRSSAAEIAPDQLAQRISPQPVVLAAAARPIRTGETITAAMIRNAMADPARHPAAATPAELIGKVATRAIAAGALIPRDAIGGEEKLAIRVPVGMRAISIDTTAEIAVAGLVRPGDRVDVQVVYPGADAISGARGAGRSRAQTLLQMVQVLAVGDAVLGTPPVSGAKDALSAAPVPARTVTLALNPEQVSTLSLAKSTGALTLSLRNPVDSEQVAVAPASSRGPDPTPVAATLPAQALTAPMQARPAPAPRQPIELVIGDRRETIYSGSAQR
ncbi:Flp pilus assembly protein CpaB [Sphingomonadales bacterium 56]|uniref:Flp pilus assembly protein CpaB n=1 Tax=unclassified Sphingobium TaxID=2611147 RepID=UPI001917CAD3|nr:MULTISPECIES: Flp pilus assembly protein CpaB [unclassified Sphingobium]MBY2930586.1 Flp pilus assembly protein CpaB [Sphingomonadales bacterium 56]MBY2960578.1 Flp pilus assembly protein CpaB [Sphingomonadales bacterium 58]